MTYQTAHDNFALAETRRRTSRYAFDSRFGWSCGFLDASNRRGDSFARSGNTTTLATLLITLGFLLTINDGVERLIEASRHDCEGLLASVVSVRLDGLWFEIVDRSEGDATS